MKKTDTPKEHTFTKRVILQWLRSGQPGQVVKALGKLENCVEDMEFAFNDLLRLIKKGEAAARCGNFYGRGTQQVFSAEITRAFLEKHHPAYLALTKDL